MSTCLVDQLPPGPQDPRPLAPAPGRHRGRAGGQGEWLEQSSVAGTAATGGRRARRMQGFQKRFPCLAGSESKGGAGSNRKNNSVSQGRQYFSGARVTGRQGAPGLQSPSGLTKSPTPHTVPLSTWGRCRAGRAASGTLGSQAEGMRPPPVSQARPALAPLRPLHRPPRALSPLLVLAHQLAKSCTPHRVAGRHLLGAPQGSLPTLSGNPLQRPAQSQLREKHSSLGITPTPPASPLTPSHC